MKKRIFHYCSICGKKLIERMPNGLLRFRFGEKTVQDENVYPVVDIKVHGSVQMRCFRFDCRVKNPDHWNTINFFPSVQPKKDTQSQEKTGQKDSK